MRRSPEWAACGGDIDGVPNLWVLNPSLWRSGQPTDDGFKNLRAQGIKTVINLRNLHSDNDEIGTTGLQMERIYFNAFRPDLDEVKRFLSIVRMPERAPFLVHCLHGSDRTGFMCAVYRVVEQGWPKEDAIEEMIHGSYGHHARLFANLPEFLWDADLEGLRSR